MAEPALVRNVPDFERQFGQPLRLVPVKLTPAQARVFEALRRVTHDGWPATVREVMREAGLTSSSTAHMHLRALARLGAVAQHPRSERGGWLPAAFS